MTATAVRHPPTFPADPDLPGAAELLGTPGGGADPVARFLAGRDLEPHRIDAAQVHYRPGRWLTVCFRTASVERTSGRPVALTVTVDCRAGAAPAVWAFPDDPALPGLAAAADPDGRLVRRRLRPRPAHVAVEPLRYRPRRRAVVRYRIAGRPALFAKVVAPRRARRLLAVADALGACDADPGLRLALPAGRLAPGALLLAALAGRPLRELVLAGGPLPPPDAAAGLVDRLHRRCSSAFVGQPPPWTAGAAASRRRVDAAGAVAAAHVVARLLPGEACAAGRLAEAVIGWSEADDPPDDRIVHGDLYENQVLVDGDAFGLIDLDDLGPGDPLLDAANFSAHLLLLAASGTASAGLIHRYRGELRAAFVRRLDADPAALAWREAYCLLRLASGPFRVLHPDWPRRMADRLALAVGALPGRRGATRSSPQRVTPGGRAPRR